MGKLSKDKFLLYSVYFNMSASGRNMFYICDVLTFMKIVGRDLNNPELMEITESEVKDFISTSDWASLDDDKINIKEAIFKAMLSQEMEENMDIVLLMRSESKLYWRKKDLCADCEKMGISCHDNLGSNLVDLRCKVNSKEIATALDIKQLRKIPPQSWCPKRRSNQLQD